MATKKDLVEAYAFSRRRLVTAFVSGAPGGREVEPVRPGRVLVGGIALSVLLLAGAAVAGFLVGRPPAQWLAEGSFVISKDTGEQYVVLRGGDDPVIQRVPNYVSAQLLLGQSDLSPHTVRDKYIRGVHLGGDLGIEGAPAGLPDEGELIADGWTACTSAEGGTKVNVQRRPQVEGLPDGGFLAASGKKLWLVALSPDTPGGPAGAYRFEMPDDPVLAGTLADRMGFDASPPQVDREWLNLFPMGAPLTEEEFGLAGASGPYQPGPGSSGLEGRSVGDLLLSEEGHYYLLGDGRPQRLTEFAGMVYDAVGRSAVRLDTEIRSDYEDPATPAEWPAALPTAAPSGQMCAVLASADEGPAAVTLAHRPTGSASAEGIDKGAYRVEVEPGGGAYVVSGDGAAAEGTPYVVDTKGARYALLGPEVPDYIGYASVSPPVLRPAWLEFFDRGVALSTNAARRLPLDAPPSEG